MAVLVAPPCQSDSSHFFQKTKMPRLKRLFGVFLIYFVQNTCGNLLVGDVKLSRDPCTNVCDNNFLFAFVKDARNVCERGCRFFNIIDAKGDPSLNKTQQECYMSCNEAYVFGDNDVCKYGCSETHKKKQLDMSSGFVVYIEQEGQNNIMFVQPELDQIDMDILSDPGLRSQLEVGYSIAYKIPETHIRTMPINEAGDNFGIPSDLTMKDHKAGDWLECASRNSGIPRWMLVSAILLAVLIGVWLIFASDKRDAAPAEPADSFLDVEYAAPPKYSLESEKV